jgi:hypothetical protein
MQIAPYVSERRKRRQKVRQYLFITIGVFAVYFIFFAVIWFLLRAPFFRVQHVVVTGNNAVATADVVALAQASPSGKHGFFGAAAGWGNMFAWPDRLPSSSLNMIPELAAVSVSKDYFSHTVTLNVTEREPFGIWCFIPKGESGVSAVATVGSSASTSASSSALASTSTASTSLASAPAPAIVIPDTGNEQCYWFDSAGVIFEKSLSTQGNLIFVVNDFSQPLRGLNETVLPPEFNSNFVSVMDVLRQTGLGIEEIDLKDLSLEEVDALTTVGPRLEFSLRFPANDYFSVLQSLIAQSGFGKLQYVDCRTEDRVFYK